VSRELETLRLIGERGHTSSGLFEGDMLGRLIDHDLVEYIAIAPMIIALTGRGSAALDEIVANGWLLGPLEARELVAAMTGTFEARITALIPFVGESARFEKIVQQLHAAGLPLEIVAFSVQLVMTENRSAVAFSLARHPDPDVRADLFYAWGGPGEGVDEYARFLPPGPPFEWTTDPMFVDLLHLGLNDEAPAVRDAAARLAYVTQSGHHVAEELVADLARAAPSVWSAPALGTARDQRSLGVLRALIAHDDVELAGSAIRGLAGRPDGHEDLLTALRDERPHIRWIAEVSLGTIATNLPAGVLEILDANPAWRTAVAHYRARPAPRKP
jgi:hypothetical protein